MQKAPRYLRFFFGTAAVVLGVVMLLIYAVDPLQFFRRDDSLPLSKEQRWQLPGLIRYYPYELAFVGTSLSENTTPALMKEMLGKEAISITLSGGTIHEQSQALRLALRTRPQLMVIWEMSLFAFHGTPDAVRDDKGGFPFYLYDTEHFNDVRYLLNGSLVWDALRALAVKGGIAPPPSMPLETLHSWHSRAHFGEEAVRQSYCLLPGLLGVQNFQWDSLELMRSFEANVLPVLRAHPQVPFTLYFPPYSLSLYRRLPEIAPIVSQWKQRIAEATASLPHVRLVDFQATPGIVDHLALYKDAIHYDQTVSRRILETIKQPVTSEVAPHVALEALLAKWAFVPPPCP